MKRETAMDVAATLGRMFGASSDRVSELAGWIHRQMNCELCMAEALEEMLRKLERFPAPKTVLAAYIEVNQSASHSTHVDTSVRQAVVGKAETFWRTTAVNLIRAHIKDEATARWVAAEMWGSGTVEGTEQAVREELEGSVGKNGNTPSVFVQTAKGRKGRPSEDQVLTMYAVARQKATFPLIDMTEEAWLEMYRQIENAMAWR